jgi:hypothetical protein
VHPCHWSLTTSDRARSGAHFLVANPPTCTTTQPHTNLIPQPHYWQMAAMTVFCGHPALGIAWSSRPRPRPCTNNEGRAGRGRGQSTFMSNQPSCHRGCTVIPASWQLAGGKACGLWLVELKPVSCFSIPLIAGAFAYAYVLAAIPPPAEIYRSCCVFCLCFLRPQPSRTPHTAKDTATACPQEAAHRSVKPP